MNDARDEIRSRINLEDLVSEYVELKRAGRNFKALSPWTNERTPSFIVSPDKQIWHDFSSGKGGDIFGFIMEVEGMEFREALEYLARKAGVELANFDSKRSAEAAEQKKKLYEISALAVQFYQYCLTKDKAAAEYVLKNRKLSKEIIKEFQIGYAPNSKQLLRSFLEKKKFSLIDIRLAGLLNRFDGDLFRGRVMIPLMDPSGASIGFTGRALKDEPNSPKYLNTPQTTLYDKSRHIFGLSQAKQSIRRDGFAVVVEGNMDVIASHQAGVKNVVATAGTAMTAQHLKSLARFAGDIRLCFDADQAGINATERTITLAQTAGVELSIITLDQSAGGAKDPDELIQKDAELWKNSIAHPQPAVDWIFDQYEKRLDIKTANGKRQFSTVALKLVENLNDPVEKEHYLDEISRRIGTSRQALVAKFSDVKQNQKPKRRTKIDKSAAKKATPKKELLYEEDLLGLAIAYKESAELLQNLPENCFSETNRDQLLEILKQNDREKLKKYNNYVKILLLKVDERYDGWKTSEVAVEITRLVQKVQKQHLEKQKDVLQDQLRDAETQSDDKLARKLLLEITKLNKEINSGKI